MANLTRKVGNARPGAVQKDILIILKERVRLYLKYGHATPFTVLSYRTYRDTAEYQTMYQF